ncbi:MAG: hypothetical protein AAF517_08590 [Planctomycetota bacterium]
MNANSEPSSYRIEQELRALRRTAHLNTLLIVLVGALVACPQVYRPYVALGSAFLCFFYLILRTYIRK